MVGSYNQYIQSVNIISIVGLRSLVPNEIIPKKMSVYKISKYNCYGRF